MSGALLGPGEWRLAAPFRSAGDRGRLDALLPIDGFGDHAARVIVVSGVPAGATRGGHGHRVARQVICAAQGAFDVEISATSSRDGAETVRLDADSDVLVAGPSVWLWLTNFSDDAIAVELFDHPHDPDELIAD